MFSDWHKELMYLHLEDAFLKALLKLYILSSCGYVILSANIFSTST